MPIRDNGNGIWFEAGANAVAVNEQIFFRQLDEIQQRVENNADVWNFNYKLKEPPEKNDKPLWDKLLYAVNEIYEPEYCCVAGGAIRDYLIGKPPKDIDIFLKLKDGDYNLDQLYEEAQCLGWKNVEILGNAGQYGHNNDFKLVLRASAFDYQVELIFVGLPKTGKEIVDSFDFYINQHWYDGEINFTPMAKRDLQKKVWTPLKGLKIDAVLREHFNRVNKRHGNIYKLDEGEPWYNKFAGKAKIR